MKIRKAIVWWIVNHRRGTHPSMTEADQKINTLMPLVETLFPGIKCRAIIEFGELTERCLMPALKKLHPELVGAPADSITGSDILEIGNFLPSKGYEWQDSDDWKKNFSQKLAA